MRVERNQQGVDAGVHLGHQLVIFATGHDTPLVQNHHLGQAVVVLVVLVVIVGGVEYM